MMIKQATSAQVVYHSFIHLSVLMAADLLARVTKEFFEDCGQGVCMQSKALNGIEYNKKIKTNMVKQTRS